MKQDKSKWIAFFAQQVATEKGFFCKCWGRRKQRSFGKNQMRTAF